MSGDAKENVVVWEGAEGVYLAALMAARWCLEMLREMWWCGKGLRALSAAKSSRGATYRAGFVALHFNKSLLVVQ